MLEARHISLAYGQTQALSDVSLRLEPGASVALMGSSGSGKSSLLHCLAGVIVPDKGEVMVDGSDITQLTDRDRSRLRLEQMGVVFQYGDLVPELTLIENVMLPLQILGTKRTAARARALDLLARLGIADLAGSRTGAVSGGQAQRAAVARAMVHAPAIVLADEPTGALDSINAEAVLDALVEMTRSTGTSLLVVTQSSLPIWTRWSRCTTARYSPRRREFPREIGAGPRCPAGDRHRRPTLALGDDRRRQRPEHDRAAPGLGDSAFPGRVVHGLRGQCRHVLGGRNDRHGVAAGARPRLHCRSSLGEPAR
jgi:putative ABC transport system ATP-binding protein